MRRGIVLGLSLTLAAPNFSSLDTPLLVLGALAFVTGLMFVMVGLLAEMLVRIYHESQGKATYVVKEMPPVEQPERDRERVAPGR